MLQSNMIQYWNCCHNGWVYSVHFFSEIQSSDWGYLKVLEVFKNDFKMYNNFGKRDILAMSQLYTNILCVL